MEKKSFGSVKVFWLNRSEALRRLREAAQAVLAACPEVLGVYLFGSLAQGRAVPGSDADVLILLEKSELRWMDRPLRFHGFFSGMGLPVDLFCYTLEEAEENLIARKALAEGLCLARRPEGDEAR